MANPDELLDQMIDAASRYEDTRGDANPLMPDAVQAADDMRDAIRALDDYMRAGSMVFPLAWCGRV